MILRFTQFKETIKFRNGINKISNINNAFMKKIFESSNSNIIIIVDLRFCKIFDYVLDKNRLNNSEIFYFNLFEGVIRKLCKVSLTSSGCVWLARIELEEN